MTMNAEILEDIIQDQLEQKQRELEIIKGIDLQLKQHYRRPIEHSFTRDQRDKTTVLFGGLTRRHERLIEGAMRGLGYNCKALPACDLNAYELGREYGNNGYCNPVYFTVGNLVRYLQSLEAKGIGRQEIIDRYVFLTVGACGPCRFGLYEEEYRLALRLSGFDGFRVLLINMTGSLNQSGEQAGLNMNLDFFLILLTALIMGDVLNQLAFQIRPYELEPGRTDKVMEEVLTYLPDVLRERKLFELNGGWKRLLTGSKLEGRLIYIGRFLDHMTTHNFVDALSKARNQFDGIQIDRFRVRPIVRIIGEFWSAMVEGDGNFNMFRFLEEEGAEVSSDQAVGTQIMRVLHLTKQRLRDRKGIYESKDIPSWWRLDSRLKDNIRHRKRVDILTLAEKLYRREGSRYQKALGGILHEIVDIYELQHLASPFYNWRCGAGENHIEIGKNIYYHMHDLCHMVLSLKPFGCMPSTQSDGAQTAVVEQYKDMIYLPIETSAEGEILAHSRVQMALDTAREKAKQEFKEALACTGRRLDELKAYVEDHPKLKRPTYRVPHRKGVVGSAARFVLHVADLMDDSGPALQPDSGPQSDKTHSL